MKQHRLARIRHAAGLALVALAVRPATAELSVVVSSATVNDALSVTSSASCVGATRVGGGFDTLATSAFVTDTAEPIAGGWRSALYNEPSGGAESFSNVAICEDSAAEPTLVSASFDVPQLSVASGLVLCPAGMTALSGGVGAPGASGSGSAMLLAPVWPLAAGGSHLRDRIDGEFAGPTAWEAVERNDLPLGAFSATVSALCADRSDVVTVIESGSVAAGTVASNTVNCPTGTRAVGGGVDASDHTDLVLVASAPVFFGFPPKRITAVADGASASIPIGWRSSVRSDASTARNLKFAAVCVPEPSGTALALAAVTALAARRRAAG